MEFYTNQKTMEKISEMAKGLGLEKKVDVLKKGLALLMLARETELSGGYIAVRHNDGTLQPIDTGSGRKNYRV